MFKGNVSDYSTGMANFIQVLNQQYNEITWMQGNISLSCFARKHSEKLVCSGHGECLTKDFCVCDEGYTGETCQQLPGEMWLGGFHDKPNTYYTDKVLGIHRSSNSLKLISSVNPLFPTLALVDLGASAYFHRITGYISAHVGNGPNRYVDQYETYDFGSIDGLLIMETRIVYLKFNNELFCVGDNRDQGCWWAPADSYVHSSTSEVGTSYKLTEQSNNRVCLVEVKPFGLGNARLSGPNHYGENGVPISDSSPVLVPMMTATQMVACSSDVSFVLNGTTLYGAGKSILSNTSVAGEFGVITNNAMYVYAVQNAPMAFYKDTANALYGWGISKFRILVDNVDEREVATPILIANNVDKLSVSSSFILLTYQTSNDIYCRGSLLLCKGNPFPSNSFIGINETGVDFVAFEENIVLFDGDDVYSWGSKTKGLVKDLRNEIPVKLSDDESIQDAYIDEKKVLFLTKDQKLWGYGDNSDFFFSKDLASYIHTPGTLQEEVHAFVASRDSILIAHGQIIGGWGKNSYHQLGFMGYTNNYQDSPSFNASCGDSSRLKLVGTDTTFGCLNLETNVFAFAGTWGTSKLTNATGVLVTSGVRDVAFDAFTQYRLLLTNRLVIIGDLQADHANRAGPSSIDEGGDLFGDYALQDYIEGEAIAVSSTKLAANAILLTNGGRVYSISDNAFDVHLGCNDFFCHLQTNYDGQLLEISSDYYYHYIHSKNRTGVIVPFKQLYQTNIPTNISDFAPIIPTNHLVDQLAYLDRMPRMYRSYYQGFIELRDERFIIPSN